MPTPPMTASPVAPFLGLRGALFAAVAALLLGWPMLATGSHLVFADTASYIRGGEIIWRLALDLLPLDAGVDATAAGNTDAAATDAQPDKTNARGEPYVVRSFVYSLYTLFAGAALWPPGFALLQAALTLWMLCALVGPGAAARPGVLLAGFVCVAAVSTLPWFASYQMPDMLAAAVVLHAMILMRRIDDLRLWQQAALVAIACLAVAAHYGHGPLAAALFGLVLAWRLLRRRLTRTAVVAALVPLVFAPLANVGASSVALDTPSVAPLRLPILLARSIQDGPARWYLERVCPEAPLTFCEVFGDDVPKSIPEFLWQDGGIASMTPEQLARIREEEFPILAHAFRAYPVQQTLSLARNAALQTVRIGTGQIGLKAPGVDGPPGTGREASRGRAVLRIFDRVTPVATWAAWAVLLALLARRRLLADEVGWVAILVAAWLANALIFGGLSAPVDRYQSRLAWLAPALAVLVLARLAGARAAVAGEA